MLWYEGVVITPLVVCATRGSSRCPHSAVPAVVNSIASCRLSSDSAPAAETRSVALPSQSRFLHRHQHHHHPTVSSSTSVDCSSSADGQLNTRVVIHPAYDNQLPLKRLHSSSEILATSASKVASIDAPLEQLCLPPPLIPVPSQPVAPSTKHPLLSTSGTWSKAQSHTPRRSLPSTPPPVPLRRSVGNIRETMSPPTPRDTGRQRRNDPNWRLSPERVCRVPRTARRLRPVHVRTHVHVLPVRTRRRAKPRCPLPHLPAGDPRRHQNIQIVNPQRHHRASHDIHVLEMPTDNVFYI